MMKTLRNSQLLLLGQVFFALCILLWLLLTPFNAPPPPPTNHQKLQNKSKHNIEIKETLSSFRFCLSILRFWFIYCEASNINFKLCNTSSKRDISPILFSFIFYDGILAAVGVFSTRENKYKFFDNAFFGLF